MSQPDLDVLQRQWTPFYECEPHPHIPDEPIFKNSRYQVQKRYFTDKDGNDHALIHLSFKRLDQGFKIPYHDKLAIKNAVAGPELEGIEVYPARSREIDTCNQFHVWCVNDPTFSISYEYDELEQEALISYQDPYYHQHYEVSKLTSRSSLEQRVFMQLVIKRLDGIIIPYRVKMLIKDAYAGPECEAMEIYPASGQTTIHSIPGQEYLLVINDPTFRIPLGFSERCVSEEELYGTKQEPWPTGERPADCLTREQLLNLLDQQGYLSALESSERK